MKLVTLFLITIFIIGCASQIPFTKNMIDEYQLDEDGIKNIQFYISHNLRLEREVTDIDKNIDPSRSLLTIEDKLIERIDFKKNTPCIVVSTNADKLNVAFEHSDNLAFKITGNHIKGKVFSYEPDQPYNKTIQTKFNVALAYRLCGIEYYADTTYAAKITTEVPYLLIDETSLKNLEINARKVKGLRHITN